MTPPATCPAAAPVLDIEAGVARLLGNRSIYLRALARFLKDYRGTGAALRHALDTGDAALAQRLTHTLKGAAAMIEAGSLHAAALALDAALRSGTDALPELLDKVEYALGAVLRELDDMGLARDLPASS